LSLGLLVSTVARTQFLASQMAMLVAFLPGLYFSGFLFEIASMPAVLRAFATIVPARYYVSGLQTIFLVGNIAAVLLPCTAILLVMSAVLFGLTALNTKQRLD
jgi:ABC-2 type transport system permease protein